ncbi:MAG: peptidyl-prolyl cis-trans isomerase [Sulfurospirillaceae bacterium]|nr:peptidyl-prolyl cis-trans isomerase [Sulfurospirillaceae bacterium]
MKKIFMSSLAALVCGVSLNAAVYANVNGEDVADEDIQMLLRSMPGAKYDALPADVKQKVLEQAIERKLLTAEAIKGGIDKDKDYQEALKKIKKDLALEVWMKKVFESMKADEKEVKEFYEKNADKFVQPATVKARHILLKTEQEAKDVIKELAAFSGDKLVEKFTEFATTKSTGPSGKNGGDLGWFAAEQMVKPFSDAAFALKSKEYTKTPVQTQYGYHIILVEDKKDGEKVGFDVVKAQIENNLKMEKFRVHVSNKAEALRKGAKIKLK